MLDYGYFKDNYILIAVDLSKPKALDANPRAIQQIVFQGVVWGANGAKIKLCTILEKSKETVLEFYKGTTKVLWIMQTIEYNKVNVKLSDSQLNKLKTAVKNQTGVTLRMNIKMFNGNNLPHKLLLTTRQRTKLRNAFENNKSIDIKLSKAQISKIIQSGGFLISLLTKLAGLFMKVAVSLSKNILAPLGITAAASAIHAGIKKKKKKKKKKKNMVLEQRL